MKIQYLIDNLELSKEVSESFKKMFLAFVPSENTQYIICKHTNRTKDVLNSDFVKVELKEMFSYGGVKLEDVYYVVENIAQFTRTAKTDYLNYGLISWQWWKHKASEEIFLTLALQNPENTFIEYLVFIPK